MTEQEALPALSQGIAQGCCRGVRLISLTCNSQVTSERIDLLAGALEVEGALTSLQSTDFPATPGASVSKLARTLRGVLLHSLSTLTSALLACPKNISIYWQTWWRRVRVFLAARD